jgi:excisionase family DNA binding protein
MSANDDDNVRAAAARKGSPFLSADQAAHYLGISRRTLNELLEHGKGPPLRKHGRQNRFHIADLEAWSDATKPIDRSTPRGPQKR